MRSPVDIVAVRGLSPALEETWRRVAAASTAHDLPGVPEPDWKLGRRFAFRWLARGPEQEIAGVAGMRPHPTHAHLAEAELHVHPEQRGRGIGSLLLDAMVAEARAQGRRGLVSWAPGCTSAERFCLRHGFLRVRTRSQFLLPLAEVHQAWLGELLDTDHPGYQLSVCRHGLPFLPGQGDAGAWFTVAARYGDVLAGHTGAIIPGGATARARQRGTAVLPEHRGWGLGLWLGAELLRHLRDAHPHVVEVETGTDEDDADLLAVHEQLGFRPYRATHEYQLVFGT